MKKLIIIIFALFLSCEDKKDEPIYGDDKHIVLKMSANNLALESRSTEQGDNALNENRVQNVHLFFFAQNAADNQLCVKHEYFTGLSFQGSGVFEQQITANRALFGADTQYDVYAIANLPSNVVIPNSLTFGAFKSLRVITPITSTALQSSLPMDGKVSVVLNPTALTPIVYVNIPLKRAVSKIRVRLNLAPGTPLASATIAQVSLKHFAKIGSLLHSNPYALTPSDYDNSSYMTATPSTAFTFYCYENNWGASTSNETYLMLNLPYGSRLSNYYRIAVNKYANSTQTGKVERNMIYDIAVYIDKDGADSEIGTLAINGNCTITDWTTREVVLKTISQHYLGINEYNIVMPNINSYTLNYVSDLPISVVSITATCTQYNSSGILSNITYIPGQLQFPTFTVNPANSTITINSSIPINYVPKHITFVVTNNQGLSLNVTVVQYSTRYVTARSSTGNVKPELVQGGTNRTLFTVNTLVPSSNGSYTLGDPTNGLAKTDSTAIGNKMVSPRFIIASQYGVYNRVTYSVAQLNRCLLYGEDIYRSGWRMPTKAEIELINSIQDDTNSAVKALLTGDAYWSAYKYDYYNFTNNSWVNTNATGTAFIRCVYDIYKDEQ